MAFKNNDINFKDIKGICLNLDTFLLSLNSKFILERINSKGQSFELYVWYYNFNTKKITTDFSANTSTPLLKIIQL